MFLISYLQRPYEYRNLQNCCQPPLVRFDSGFKDRRFTFAPTFDTYVCIYFIYAIFLVLRFFRYVITVLASFLIAKIVLHLFFMLFFYTFHPVFNSVVCNCLFVYLLACLVFDIACANTCLSLFFAVILCFS